MDDVITLHLSPYIYIAHKMITYMLYKKRIDYSPKMVEWVDRPPIKLKNLTNLLKI